MNKRSVGTQYEQLAAEELRKEGAVPVETNFRCRMGEIDLIYREDKYLVFAEVKYRSGSRFGSAAEAVTPAKQRKICKVAAFYLQVRGIPDGTPVRFDVIAIDGGGEGPVRIGRIRDAFPFAM